MAVKFHKLLSSHEEVVTGLWSNVIRTKHSQTLREFDHASSTPSVLGNYFMYYLKVTTVCYYYYVFVCVCMYVHGMCVCGCA